MLDDAREDQAKRLARHASNCVLLASVTPVAIAGELIDKAITLRAAEQSLRRG
jgi:predicted house-cleaning NTP pyrophosphatase (Maf/HAM1 superfamily)